jgi:hypothetical protein
VTRLLSVLAIAAIALLAACVPDAASDPSTASVDTSATTSQAPESVAPPTASASPATTASPSPGPSNPAAPTPPTPSPNPGASSGSEGSASACSGSDGNRDFFADAAGDLAWPVYCAVLPRGWFVDTGEYRLGNGGYLTITYEGPGGALFEIRQGAVCQATDDCEPGGAVIGEASFADRTGTLVDLGAGDLAVIVDPGAALTWLATGTALEESLFRAIAADLVEVSG